MEYGYQLKQIGQKTKNKKQKTKTKNKKQKKYFIQSFQGNTK